MKQERQSFALAFLASAIMHAVLLFLLFNLGGGIGSQGFDSQELGSKEINVEIVPRQADVKKYEELAEQEVSVEIRTTKADNSEQDSQDCPIFFGGIGIVMTTLLGRVLKVSEGYPASRAGILPGDFIVEDVKFIKGEIGTPINVTVIRDAETLKFSMIREKICVIEKGAIKEKQ